MHPLCKNTIPCCTGQIIHNNSVFFQHRIHHGTFTHIGSPNYAHLDWLLFHRIFRRNLPRFICTYRDRINRVNLTISVKVWVFFRAWIQTVNLIFKVQSHLFKVNDLFIVTFTLFLVFSLLRLHYFINDFRSELNVAFLSLSLSILLFLLCSFRNELLDCCIKILKAISMLGWDEDGFFHCMFWLVVQLVVFFKNVPYKPVFSFVRNYNERWNFYFIFRVNFFDFRYFLIVDFLHLNNFLKWRFGFSFNEPFKKLLILNVDSLSSIKHENG